MKRKTTNIVFKTMQELKSKIDEIETTGVKYDDYILSQAQKFK